jgi:hypothetical protein
MSATALKGPNRRPQAIEEHETGDMVASRSCAHLQVQGIPAVAMQRHRAQAHDIGHRGSGEILSVRVCLFPTFALPRPSAAALASMQFLPSSS